MQLWRALYGTIKHVPTPDRWERFVLSWVRLLLVLTPVTDGDRWTPMVRGLQLGDGPRLPLPGEDGWCETGTPPLWAAYLFPGHLRRPRRARGSNGAPDWCWLTELLKRAIDADISLPQGDHLKGVVAGAPPPVV